MRWSRSLVVSALLVLLAACSSPGGGDDGGPDNGGNGNGNEQSQAVDPTPVASTDDGSAGNDDGGNDDGGNGGASGSIDGLIDDLTPPNSTEISRTTVEGGAIVGWTSSDSPDSLKGFYEQAIGDAGYQIVSTTQASGSYSWVFAESEGSSNGGSITVAPGSDGTSASTVLLTATLGG